MSGDPACFPNCSGLDAALAESSQACVGPFPSWECANSSPTVQNLNRLCSSSAFPTKTPNASVRQSVPLLELPDYRTLGIHACIPHWSPPAGHAPASGLLPSDHLPWNPLRHRNPPQHVESGNDLDWGAVPPPAEQSGPRKMLTGRFMSGRLRCASSGTMRVRSSTSEPSAQQGSSIQHEIVPNEASCSRIPPHSTKRYAAPAAAW